MKMFNGEAKPSSRIALRGQSRREPNLAEQKELIRKQRALRQKRALEQKSSTTIQAAWRTWVDLRNAKKRMRIEWYAEYERVPENALSALTWESISRMIFFFDVQSPNDIHTFAVVCRVLVTKVCNEGKESTHELDSYVVRILSKATEKSLSIIKNKAAEWATLLLVPFVRDSFESDVHSIAKFLYNVLDELEDHFSPMGNTRFGFVQRLIQKDALTLLVNVIETCIQVVRFRSLEGSIIERLIVAMLEQTGHSTTLENSSGVFHLLTLPSLKSLSSGIRQKSCKLMMNICPILNLICTSEIQAAKELKIDLKSPNFNRSCILVFQNLVELGVEELRTEDPIQSQSSIVTTVLEFMNRVIQQNLNTKTKDDDAMSVDNDDIMSVDDEDVMSVDGEDEEIFSNDDEKNGILFNSCSPDFKNCMQKLHEFEFQKFFLNIIQSLFSTPSLNSEQMTSFCSFMHFVIDTTFHGRRESLLLFLEVSGQLVERLWRQWIAPRWNESKKMISDSERLSLILAPLGLLCEIYSSYLCTTSQTEFCEEQRPLKIIEIYDPQNPGNGLITVLKSCLLTSVNANSTTTRNGSYLKSIVFPRFPSICGNLLRQLHENCSRWDLVPPQHFHLQNAQLGMFTNGNGFVSIQGGPPNETAVLGNRRATTILYEAPFLIPFEERVQIFYTTINRDQSGRPRRPTFMGGSTQAKIRRNRLVYDAFEQLATLSSESYKGSLAIEFVDEHGMLEAGIDGGGLTKEFIESVLKEGFDPAFGFFEMTEKNELYPNPSAILEDNSIEIMTFFGRLLGKAVYEGILLELPIAYFFLKKFLRQHCVLHDLPSMEPALYTNLLRLRNDPHLEALDLRFVITSKLCEAQEIELKPNGSEIVVTKENVVEFTYRFADYRLNKEIRELSDAFLCGFFDVIGAPWVQMFTATELKMLISGSQQRLDLVDMRKHVVYSGGYSNDHRVIADLWDVLEHMSNEQQRLFLKFVTGCSRAPLLGFAKLSPPVSIHMAGSETTNSDPLRLPSSATCANLLKLPPYSSREVLKEKLLVAITEKTGFYLS